MHIAKGELNVQMKGTKGTFARIREEELSNFDKLFKKLQNQIDMIAKRTDQINQPDDIDRMFDLLTKYCLSLNTVETHVKRKADGNNENEIDGEAYELRKFNEALSRRSQMDKIGSRFEKTNFQYRESIALPKYKRAVKNMPIDNWHKKVLSNRGRSPLATSGSSTPANYQPHSY